MSSSLFFMLGRPLSPIYSLAMHLRAAGYRRGVFKAHAMGVPVISVGNLTMGGTGKTPLVQYLARLLQEKGFAPAVVSRGYGGKAKERVNVVSDGTAVHLDARLAGDEPNLLAKTLPGVPVFTGVVRRLPARAAVDKGADVLLLDDGFQHLAVRRDLDLVLFNADTLAGNSRVFPGGDLREPVSALLRSDGFIITGVEERNQDRAQQFCQLLDRRFPGRAIWQTGYAPAGWVRADEDGVLTGVDGLPSGKVFAFCGIARPEAFRRTLGSMVPEIAGFLPLADHFSYDDAALARLQTRAVRAGADMLLTTEKDLVKLCGMHLSLPCFGLRMQVHAEPAFDRWVLDHLGRGLNP